MDILIYEHRRSQSGRRWIQISQIEQQARLINCDLETSIYSLSHFWHFFQVSVAFSPIFEACFTNWIISLKRRALPENGHGGLKPVLDKWTQKLVPSNQQLSERPVHNMAIYLFFFTLLTNSHSFIKVVLKGPQNSIPTINIEIFCSWANLVNSKATFHYAYIWWKHSAEG